MAPLQSNMSPSRFTFFVKHLEAQSVSPAPVDPPSAGRECLCFINVASKKHSTRQRGTSLDKLVEGVCFCAQMCDVGFFRANCQASHFHWYLYLKREVESYVS